MTETVIRAESIGKRYRVGERERYVALRDVLANAIKFRRRAKKQPKDFVWAVREVSFDIKRGEIVGLIGRNGAGKTTLLKLLARITRPTSGWVEIHGRIGSLLEVGTGFHPELTGRENIFLSGAILGMSRAEIRRKYDEIVAFAEVERFIDTPLKHFSSGMQMRLAFAVAAHLEPEILLVDEVLAVGDITFQKKCLGKMGDVARAGRTVVLVSHNMSAINSLCSRCLILSNGALAFDGGTAQATTHYYAESLEIVESSDLSSRRRDGNGKARFTSISVQAVDSDSRPIDVAYPGCDLRVTVQLACYADFPAANLAIIFYDSSGYRIIDTNTAQKGEFVSLQADQVANACFLLREVLLRPGKYLVGLWLGRAHMETIDHIEDAASLDFVEHTKSGRHTETFPGTYLCRFEQTVSVVQPSLTEIAGRRGS